MMHIDLSKREKYIFILTTIFIVLVLLYNSILEPAFKKWQAVNKEIVIKKIRCDKGIRVLERRDAIIEQYNKYTSSMKNISKILSCIQNLADSLGIRTSNIRPGQALDNWLYKEYNIELQIEGQFSEIIKFLSELIKPPNFIILKKFDFRVNQENPNSFKGTITLSKIII